MTRSVVDCLVIGIDRVVVTTQCLVGVAFRRVRDRVRR